MKRSFDHEWLRPYVFTLMSFQEEIRSLLSRVLFFVCRLASRPRSNVIVLRRLFWCGSVDRHCPFFVLLHESLCIVPIEHSSFGGNSIWSWGPFRSPPVTACSFNKHGGQDDFWLIVFSSVRDLITIQDAKKKGGVGTKGAQPESEKLTFRPNNAFTD